MPTSNWAFASFYSIRLGGGLKVQNEEDINKLSSEKNFRGSNANTPKIWASRKSAQQRPYLLNVALKNLKGTYTRIRCCLHFSEQWKTVKHKH